MTKVEERTGEEIEIGREKERVERERVHGRVDGGKRRKTRRRIEIEDDESRKTRGGDREKKGEEKRKREREDERVERCMERQKTVFSRAGSTCRLWPTVLMVNQKCRVLSQQRAAAVRR